MCFRNRFASTLHKCVTVPRPSNNVFRFIVERATSRVARKTWRAGEGKFHIPVCHCSCRIGLQAFATRHLCEYIFLIAYQSGTPWSASFAHFTERCNFLAFDRQFITDRGHRCWSFHLRFTDLFPLITIDCHKWNTDTILRNSENFHGLVVQDSRSSTVYVRTPRPSE